MPSRCQARSTLSARCLSPWALLALAACEGSFAPPPPYRTFEGLPVSGRLADARAAGFAWRLDGNASMRCRRSGVRLADEGPYEAAVDLGGSDGRGGFDRLTLWHDRDQHAVQAVGEALKRRGWSVCFTGDGPKGDQAIYAREGAAVTVAIDLSYYMKRRLRVFPVGHPLAPRCTPPVVRDLRERRV